MRAGLILAGVIVFVISMPLFILVIGIPLVILGVIMIVVGVVTSPQRVVAQVAYSVHLPPPQGGTGPDPGSKFCPSCGARMTKPASYCPACGKQQ